MSVWAHSRPTDHGFRDAEGHYGDIDEPPALVPGVNMGSSVPRERKISTEQQGAGDGLSDRRQWDGLTPLTG